MTKILLVDDEIEIIEGRSKIIKNLGYDCLTAQSGNEADKIIKEESPDIILTDIKMPDGDGLAVLNAAKDLDPDIPVIVFTGHGSRSFAALITARPTPTGIFISVNII